MSTVLTSHALADPPADQQEDHPLSFPQEQLWLIESLEPTGGLYNEVWVLRIEGKLDTSVLERCLDTVVARHDVLRSSFHLVDGVPRCRVAPLLEVSLGAPIDLGHIPAAERDLAVAEIAGSLADRPYDLSAGPLLRCSLLRLGTHEHVLVIGTHHIIADGWSLDVLISEIRSVYPELEAGRPAGLPPLSVQYADFARWQRNRQHDELWAQDLEYWRRQLAGAPPLLDLSVGRLRPAAKRAHGKRIRVDLPAGLAAGVGDLALRTASTKACVLMSAFAAVLYRHTGHEDLVIGTATAGRPEEEFEPLVGFFANTLPLRLRPSADLRFGAFLDQVTETSLDALEHQDVPFVRLVEELCPERDPSYAPVVQVLFSHSEAAAPLPADGGISLRSEQVSRSRSRFDLLVETQIAEQGMSLWVEFDDELFTESRVRSMCGHYENLLGAVLRDHDVPLGEIPMLSSSERGRAIAAMPPVGAPTPALDVVLLGSGMLAPSYAVGVVRQVHPVHGSLTGDRLVGTGRPTGELGYWTDRGELVRLGPIERLPVLNGARIPLDEVRAAIAVYPAVRSVEVTAGPAGPLAKVVTGYPLDGAELRDYLGTRLPKYAVPVEFELTGAPSARPEDPADERELALRDRLLTVLREGLQNAELGIDDDFFVAGGHSMLAAQLVQRLRDEYSLTTTLRQFFRNPTARELAGALTKGGPGAAPAPVREAPAARPAPERVALTAAQTDIWVVNRLAPDEPVYNTPIAITIDGPLDAGALRRAFDAVIAANPVLRSGFGLDGGALVQWPLECAPELRTTSLSCLPLEQRAGEAARLRQQEAVHVFAVDTEPAVRAKLLVHHETHHELLLTFHHIAIDGVGLHAFNQQLGECYRAITEGGPPELPDVPLTWSAYADWEAKWVASGQPELLDYWRTRLESMPQLELPTDHPRPQKLSFAGAHLEHRLAEVSAQELLALARRHRVSPLMVTTAALAMVAGRLSGSTDLPIGTASENRQLPDAERLIGCCITMLVLRVDLSGDPSFAELLDRVRDTTLDAYEHQGLPLPKLIRAAGARRDAGRMALFQLASDWQEPERAGLRLKDCTVDWRYVSTGRARNDLSLTALRRGPHIDLELEYSTALWTPEGARRWLDAVGGVLTEAVADPGRRLSGFSG